MELKHKTDIIVVGAGPAGVAAAITAARNGADVVLVERGNFAGAKNMFGGAIYSYPFDELYPGFEKNFPIERINNVHEYIIADDDSSVKIRYQNDNQKSSFAVTRAAWDRFCVKEAEKEGVVFVPETPVLSLIKDNGKIVGIQTAREKFFADIVIVADGVNSLLAKEAGLRKDIPPSKLALGVKEVLKLPEEVINQRFNLDSGKGYVGEIFSGPFSGMCALGFVYTFKNSIAIGFGAALDEFEKHKITPYELLNKLKKHSCVRDLIKDGELIEYSAHLIPEGADIPKLYTDGALLAGDAAMLVNNLNWEGTNLAAESGRLAGLTAAEAIKKGDFSAVFLKNYEKRLKNSFVLKDIKTLKPVVPLIHDNSEAFLGFWTQRVNEFFKMFTHTGNTPKAKLYQDFIKDSFKKRGCFNLFSDMIKIFTTVLKILFGGKK